MLSLKVLEKSLNLIIKLSGNSELESSLLKDFTVTGADPWGPEAPAISLLWIEGVSTEV